MEMEARLALEVAFGRGGPSQTRGVKDTLQAAHTLIVNFLDEAVDVIG